MRYQSILVFFLALFSAPFAYGAVSEIEPNSPVTGSGLLLDDASSSCALDALNHKYCTVSMYRSINAPYDSNNPNFDPYSGSAADPSLAKPLSLTDELRGQLSGTRDFDWSYVDISPQQAQNQGETPVYFGCDNKFGVYYEGYPTGTVPTADDTFWQINYYYDPDPNAPGGLEYQSSYVVYKEMCKRGVSETKGPFRFQMNTTRAGRYYVRVSGAYKGDREEDDTGSVLVAQNVPTKSVTLQSVTAANGNVPASATVSLSGAGLIPIPTPISVGTAFTFVDGTTVSVKSVVTDTNPNTASLSVNNQAPAILSPGQSITIPGGIQTLSVDTKTKKLINQIVVNTAFYGLRLYTAKVGGELEPNDGMIEAYSLSSGITVSAQLSSMYDQDWFYIDNDISKNTTKKLPFYFNCKGQTGSVYILSAYDHLGVLQSNYEIKSEQCNGASGFSFTIDAPITARYYFEVSSPTFTDTAQFTQSDYSVLAIASNQSITPVDVPTRKEGELEPNERPVDAYPLPKNVGVAAQLSSNTDLDWFAINYVADQNTTGVTLVSFDCTGLAGSSAVWELSGYNPQNVLQASYTITASQCSVSGGFAFSLSTPITGKYLLLVNAVASTDPATFSQANYTLRWNPVMTAGSVAPPAPISRLPGELEPNDTLPNAFPLTNDQAVTAQLSSVDDLDYYYYDVASQNPSDSIPIYFGCNAPAGAGKEFSLAYFNAQGLLQKSYAVSTDQCSAQAQAGTTAPAMGGFRFDMITSGNGRYYILVAGPADKDLGKFSDTDYTLSTFLNVAGQIPQANAGNLSAAKIVDSAAANRDSFAVTIRQCGPKGAVKLSGKKLNLTGLDKNSQILVQIGQWSCLTNPKELTARSSSAAKKAFVYPKPTPLAPPPVKKPTISGRS